MIPTLDAAYSAAAAAMGSEKGQQALPLSRRELTEVMAVTLIAPLTDDWRCDRHARGLLRVAAIHVRAALRAGELYGCVFKDDPNGDPPAPEVLAHMTACLEELGTAEEILTTAGAHGLYLRRLPARPAPA